MFRFRRSGGLGLLASHGMFRMRSVFEAPHLPRHPVGFEVPRVVHRGRIVRRGRRIQWSPFAEPLRIHFGPSTRVI